MTSRRDIEQKLDDLESEGDADAADPAEDSHNDYEGMTDDELAEAWRAALDPERESGLVLRGEGGGDGDS